MTDRRERERMEGENARLREALEQAVDYFDTGHCVCEQTKQMCIAALAQPQPANSPVGAVTLAEACEPWKHCAPELPEWDSPLMDVWQAACGWTMNIVGKTMGATDWEGGDGSETIEGDIAAEVSNIMRAAGLVDTDGDPVTRDVITRLRSAPQVTDAMVDRAAIVLSKLFPMHVCGQIARAALEAALGTGGGESQA